MRTSFAEYGCGMSGRVDGALTRSGPGPLRDARAAWGRRGARDRPGEAHPEKSHPSLKRPIPDDTPSGRAGGHAFPLIRPARYARELSLCRCHPAGKSL